MSGFDREKRQDKTAENVRIGSPRSGVDVDLIPEQWDQLVRVAASLKNRVCPAHVVVQRLANSSPSDRLAKALTIPNATQKIRVARTFAGGARLQFMSRLAPPRLRSFAFRRDDRSESS
ncbi:MAG: Tn3 family transposase [Verrucomicrobia bacterium]|nr:Tn3 family transposase [Verrucomicrobiota bacterium]